MARPAHRHRRIRLDSTARMNAETRVANEPRKTSERARRDARMLAALKAKGPTAVSLAVKSWVCAQLDKQWRQVTPADLAKLTA